MDRNHKPELAPYRAARVVCALAAVIVTWSLFGGMVSMAEARRMAMAGHHGNEEMAKHAASAPFVLAQAKEAAVASR